MQWKLSTSTTAVILASNAPEYSSVVLFSSAKLEEKVYSMPNFYNKHVIQFQGDCPKNSPYVVGNFSDEPEASECPTGTCSATIFFMGKKKTRFTMKQRTTYDNL
jgi:hypothetical protein